MLDKYVCRHITEYMKLCSHCNKYDIYKNTYLLILYHIGIKHVSYIALAIDPPLLG